MSNPWENKQERTFSREEVLEVILRFAEQSAEIVEEVEDENGVLFRFTAKAEGEKPGHTNEYEYMRKGRIDGGGGGTLTSSIDVVYYIDGMPISGENLAVYDENLGEWQDKR